MQDICDPVLWSSGYHTCKLYVSHCTWVKFWTCKLAIYFRFKIPNHKALCLRVNTSNIQLTVKCQWGRKDVKLVPMELFIFKNGKTASFLSSEVSFIRRWSRLSSPCESGVGLRKKPNWWYNFIWSYPLYNRFSIILYQLMLSPV